MTLDTSHAVGRSWLALTVAFRRAFRAPRPALRSYPVLPLTGLTVFFFLALVVFVVAGFVWFDDDVGYYALGHKTEKSSAFYFFNLITDIGTSGWVLVSSALFGLFVSVMNMETMSRAKRWFWASIQADLNFICCTIAVTGILASLLKHIIGRARPKHLETLGHLEFDFARFEASFASFPSGHSTTFGALCMVLFLLLPRKLWPLWLFFAVVGGGSRIMVGAHYPSDVAAGLVFGAVLTLLSARWLAKRRVMFDASAQLFPARKIRSRNAR